MSGKRRHVSWMDLFRDYPLPEGVGDAEAKRYIFELDDALHEHWGLGRNLIQCWAPGNVGIHLLVVPHFKLEEFAAREHLIEAMLTGSKQTTPAGIVADAELFGTEPVWINLSFDPMLGLGPALIDALVRRFGISLVKNRAVALFDIVGFSLLSPLEQVTQLNSLSYSVNAAQSKLMQRSINISFARSTTGDGYYIWNCSLDARANTNLFDLMQLILADNANAHRKAHGKTVPVLKSCFHIGPHYEYYQAVGVNPSTFSYIVGEVSIELARMIEQCLPGQILIGDFACNDPEVCPDTLSFIDQVEAGQAMLRDVALSGEGVESVHCRLTGEQGCVRRYRISDKHQLMRHAYNVNIDIAVRHMPPLLLGIDTAGLGDFEARSTIDYSDLPSRS